MKIACVSCKTQYDIDEKKIPDSGMSVSCPKCNTVFEIFRPGEGDDAAPPAEPPPPPKDESDSIDGGFGEDGFFSDDLPPPPPPGDDFGSIDGGFGDDSGSGDLPPPPPPASDDFGSIDGGFGDDSGGGDLPPPPAPASDDFGSIDGGFGDDSGGGDLPPPPPPASDDFGSVDGGFGDDFGGGDLPPPPPPQTDDPLGGFGDDPPPPPAGGSYMVKTMEGIETGPFNLDTLINLIRNGKMVGSEMVSKDNSPYVTPPELAELASVCNEVGFSPPQSPPDEDFNFDDDEGGDFHLEDESPLDDIPSSGGGGDSVDSDFSFGDPDDKPAEGGSDFSFGDTDSSSTDSAPTDFSFGDTGGDAPPPPSGPAEGFGFGDTGGGSFMDENGDAASALGDIDLGGDSVEDPGLRGGSFGDFDEVKPPQSGVPPGLDMHMPAKDALNTEMKSIISELEEKTPRSKLPLIIGLTVVVVLAVVGGLAALLITSDSLPRSDGSIGKLSNYLQETIGTEGYKARMAEDNLKLAEKNIELYSANSLADAEQELGEVLKFAPATPSINAMRARAAMGAIIVGGKIGTEEAKKAAERATGYLGGSAGDGFEALMAEAEIAVGKGDFDKALEVAEKLVAADESAAGGYYLRSLVAWYRNGDSENALAQLEAALGSKPNSVPYNFLKIRIFSDKEDEENLMKAADDLLAKTPGHIATMVIKGEFLYQVSKKYEEAAKIISEILNKYGSSLSSAEKGSIHYHLGQIFMLQKNYDLAGTQFKSAIGEDPSKAEYYVGVGKSLMKKNKVADAIMQLQTAISKDPDTIAGHTYLGVLQESLQKFDDARASYEKALSLDPGNVEANSFYGNFLLKQGEPEKAEESFKKAVEAAPDDPMVHLEYAKFLSYVDRNKLAEKEFEKVLELKPENNEAVIGLGNVYLNMGKTEKAIQYLKKAEKDNPSNAGVMHGLGKAHYDTGSYKAAIASFRRAISIDPGYVQAIFDLGRTYVALGELDKAESQFNSALEQDPNFSDALHGRGEVYLMQERNQSAESDLKKASALNPGNAAFQFTYGKLLNSIGKDAAANEQFEKTLTLDPKFWQAKLALGRFEFLSMHDDEAIPLLKEALEINRKSGEANYMLAAIHTREPNKDDKKAKGYFNRALSNAKGKDLRYKIHLARGEFLYQNGEHNSGISDLKKATAINSEDGRPHMLLGFAYKEKDPPDIDAARKNFQKALAKKLSKTDELATKEALKYLY